MAKRSSRLILLLAASVAATAVSQPHREAGAEGLPDGSVSAADQPTIPGAPPFLIDEMSFRDQPVRDILLALGRATGRSIIPDETVTGRASYYFSNTTVDAALSAFLPTVQLYSWQEAGVRFVSRIRVTAEEGLLSVSADRVEPRMLIERIAAASGTAVSFRSIPTTPVSLHLTDGTPEDALRLTIENLPSHELRRHGPGFSVIEAPRAPAATGRFAFREDGGRYTLSVFSAPLSEILQELFQQSSRDWIWMLDEDPMIRHLNVSTAAFDGLLEALLRAGGARLHRAGDLLAVVPRDRYVDSHRQYELHYVTLHERGATELISQLPMELRAGVHLEPSADNSAVALYATAERRKLIVPVVRALDRAPQAETRRMELSHAAASRVIATLPPWFSSVEIAPLDGDRSLVATAAPGRLDRLARFIAELDAAPKVRTIQLANLTGEELVAHLPPDVEPAQVSVSPDPHAVYVRASQARFREIAELVRRLDAPPEQLRYHVLIVEHYRSDRFDWETSFELSPQEPGIRNSVTGALGELLSLGLDVVALYGYRFAAELKADLGENSAVILADAELRGLPKAPVRFEHTSTYRYRDPLLAQDGGSTVAAVTREIISGITIELSGSLAHDGFIAVDIDASLSKRGADVSSGSTNPPPTAEKRLQTRVRLRPGEPVALGGLSRVDDTRTVQRTPLLGSIPFLGWLFKSSGRVREDARTVIYLVARVDRHLHPVDSRRRMEELYRELLAEEIEP